METNISVLNELLGKGFWLVNKRLVKTIGLEETLLLSDLLAKYTYFSDKNELDRNGFFFNTRENIEEDTTLTPYQQRKAITKLKKLGLVKTKEQGLPKKTYYKIDIQKVYDLLLKDLTTSSEKTSPLDVKKLHINNNKDNNNKNNNTSNEDIAEGKIYTKQITLIMDLFKVIDTGYARHFKNTTERNACKELYSAYGIDAVQKRIEFVPQYNKLPYIGSYAKIYKPSDLLRNWVRMEDEIITYKNTKQEKSNKFKII